MNLAETALEVSRKRDAERLENALRPLKNMDKFRDWVLSLNIDCKQLELFIWYIQQNPDTKSPSNWMGVLKEMFIRYLCNGRYWPIHYDEFANSMSDDQVNRFFYDMVNEFEAVGLSFVLVDRMRRDAKCYIQIVGQKK